MTGGTNVSVRVKETDTTKAGAAQSFVIPDFKKADGPAAPTGLVAVAPTAADAADGKVTGVDETMEYSTDGGTTWKPVVGTEITGLTGGTNISVRVKETDTTKAGTAQSFVIPDFKKADGPAAPTGLVVVAPTSVDGTDGKVTGVDETMEYSTDGGTTWKPVVGTEITGLTGGTNVSVRVKETDTTKAGTAKTVVIPGTFNVIVTNDGHGTASASPASGKTGMQVTLTATPSASYEFDHWEVISGGVTVTDDQFTIGTADVEIKACFKASSLPYKIIEGANQDIYQNAESATFRSNADYSKFLYVEVDGNKLSKSDFDSRSGSTVIVLKRNFIKKLGLGVHTLRIVSNDGSASTKFTIRKVPPTGDNTPVALLSLLLVGAICLAVLTIRKRKA